jgi:hypothetical protein
MSNQTQPYLHAAFLIVAVPLTAAAQFNFGVVNRSIGRGSDRWRAQPGFQGGRHELPGQPERRSFLLRAGCICPNGARVAARRGHPAGFFQ